MTESNGVTSSEEELTRKYRQKNEDDTRSSSFRSSLAVDTREVRSKFRPTNHIDRVIRRVYSARRSASHPLAHPPTHHPPTNRETNRRQSERGFTSRSCKFLLRGITDRPAVSGSWLWPSLTTPTDSRRSVRLTIITRITQHTEFLGSHELRRLDFRRNDNQL